MPSVTAVPTTVTGTGWSPVGSPSLFLATEAPTDSKSAEATEITASSAVVLEFDDFEVSGQPLSVAIPSSATITDITITLNVRGGSISYMVRAIDGELAAEIDGTPLSNVPTGLWPTTEEGFGSPASSPLEWTGLINTGAEIGAGFTVSVTAENIDSITQYAEVDFLGLTITYTAPDPPEFNAAWANGSNVLISAGA